MIRQRKHDPDYVPTSRKKARFIPKQTVGISYCQPSEAPGQLEPPTFRQPANVGLWDQVLGGLTRTVLTNLGSMTIGVIEASEVSSYALQAKHRQSICREVIEGVSTLHHLEPHCETNRRLVLHFHRSHGAIFAASTLEAADLLLVVWTYKGTAAHTNNYRLCVEVYVDAATACMDPLVNTFAIEAEKMLTAAFSSARISELRTAYCVELCARRQVLPSGVLVTDWFTPVQPVNFTKYGSYVEGYGYPIGVKSYENVFNDAQTNQLEQHVRSLMARPKSSYQSPMTRQDTATNDRIKFFFDVRYIFGKEGFDENDGTAGLRVDVDPSPAWLRGQVEEPLIAAGLVPANWIDFHAINVYVTGSRGLISHKDEWHRFEGSVCTIRLFSSSRLTFDGKGLGMTNPEFFVPLPRAGVLLLDRNGWAANEVKHGIRPCDMSGLSASIILRRTNQERLAAAKRLHKL